MTEIAYRSPTYYELPAPPELDWRPYRRADYLDYRAQWQSRGTEGRAGSFPLHLDVDPTNRCNLLCPMCPRTYYLENHKTKWAPHGLGDMDFSLYESLIKEGSQKGLKSVKLNFLGEPLLYPKIVDMVSVAAQAGLWVMLNTNAVALTPRLGQKLLEAGLTDIFFSFDSPYPQEYEAIRVGAKFQKVLNNIGSFMKIKDQGGFRSVQTRASLVLPAGSADHEAVKRDYIKLFRDLKVAEIGFGLPTQMDFDYSPVNPPSFLCPDLFRRIFVFQDGVCGPCCGDWERNIEVGNFADGRSLADIWQGGEYKNLRQKHIEGRYKDIWACLNCSVPYLSTVEL